MARIPELPFRITGAITGCTAACLRGARIHGGHTGIGRALLLRHGSRELESLVEEHFLHEVAARLPDPAFTTLPRNIIVGGLGSRGAIIGVDTFERDVVAGDVVVLCSKRLPIVDDELATLAAVAGSADELATHIARAVDAQAGGAGTAFAVGVVR